MNYKEKEFLEHRSKSKNYVRDTEPNMVGGSTTCSMSEIHVWLCAGEGTVGEMLPNNLLLEN